jgi:hypothetical protein
MAIFEKLLISKNRLPSDFNVEVEDVDYAVVNNFPSKKSRS